MQGRNTQILLKRGEALYDPSGYIRVFYMLFDDGAMGNFVLMPNNKTRHKLIELANEIFVPIGLKVIGQQVFNTKNEDINNIARYVTNTFAKAYIQEIVNNYNFMDQSYYAIDNQERVFEAPINISKFI